jgi:hypothetical protein
MVIFMYHIDMTIWVDPFTPDELYNSTIYYENGLRFVYFMSRHYAIFCCS